MIFGAVVMPKIQQDSRKVLRSVLHYNVVSLVRIIFIVKLHDTNIGINLRSLHPRAGCQWWRHLDVSGT